MTVHELVQSLVAAAADPSDPLKAVTEAIEAALPASDDLLAELALPDALVATPLYRTPLVTVMAHVWPPGMAAPAHEHRMWSVVASLRGTERHLVWAHEPSGDPRVVEVTAGTALALDEDAVHAVDNPNDDYAVSIHVYGGDLMATERRGWSPVSGEAEALSSAFLGRLLETWNAKQRAEPAPLTPTRTRALLRETIEAVRASDPPAPLRTPDGVAYDDRGSGPPIVFLHGLTFDRHTWDPIVEPLVDAHRCVTLDLPGHGDTRFGGDHEAAVEAVASVVRHLGLDRPLVVGHSAGAVMGALYAARAEVAGLLCVDQPLLAGRFAAMLKPIADELRSPRFPRCWESFERSLGLDHLPLPVRAELLLHHTVRQDTVLQAWSWLLAERPEEVQAEVDRRLRRIRAPLLSIHGRDPGPDYAAWLTRATSGPTRVVSWDGSGHFPHLARTGPFVEALREFAREAR